MYAVIVVLMFKTSKFHQNEKDFAHEICLKTYFHFATHFISFF